MNLDILVPERYLQARQSGLPEKSLRALVHSLCIEAFLREDPTASVVISPDLVDLTYEMYEDMLQQEQAGT